jgi:hypothetical protein
VSHIPKGDPDCRLGVKRSRNQVQPDGTKKEKKVSLFGYGTGVAACTDPTYGNVDAAYDFWYVYETVAHRDGIAAVPLNSHGHEEVPRDPDGTAYCSCGLRMHPVFFLQHTNGYRALRFRCPLLFPERTGHTCDHDQFAKGRGCVKDLNWEKGGLMRALLDRHSALFRTVYNRRTACERINSQAKALGIETPKVRNGRSVRTLNTLIYVLINVQAFPRVSKKGGILLVSIRTECALLWHSASLSRLPRVSAQNLLH